MWKSGVGGDLSILRSGIAGHTVALSHPQRKIKGGWKTQGRGKTKQGSSSQGEKRKSRKTRKGRTELRLCRYCASSGGCVMIVKKGSHQRAAKGGGKLRGGENIP